MTDIAEAVKDWVASVLGDGVETAYGRLPDADVACEVKSAPGDPWVKRYLDGGGIKAYRYEVYLRVQPRGLEAPRFDAIAALRALQARVESGEAPCDGVTWLSHDVEQTPAEFSTEQDGRAVYQLTAKLTYQERGKDAR